MRGSGSVAISVPEEHAVLLSESIHIWPPVASYAKQWRPDLLSRLYLGINIDMLSCMKEDSRTLPASAQE